MEEIQESKREIRTEVGERFGAFSKEELRERISVIESRVFEFANFLESNIVLFYVAATGEVDPGSIVKRAYDYGKIVVLPAFQSEGREMTLLKVDRPEIKLRPGPRGVRQPDPVRSKVVPIDCIDIAFVPGIAFDEKGGRIGTGRGYYDRIIPKLPLTTRKVSLAFEAQMVPQIPMEPHDRHVDIIITENRVIYKI